MAFNVKAVFPFIGYKDSDSVDSLREATSFRNAKNINIIQYDEIGGKLKDNNWEYEVVEKDPLIQNAMALPLDYPCPNSVREDMDTYLHEKERIKDIGILQMNNERMLIREELFNSKTDEYLKDRYYLFDKGKLVTNPSEIAEIILDETGIFVPEMNLKYLDGNYFYGGGYAEFVTNVKEAIKAGGTEHF